MSTFSRWIPPAPEPRLGRSGWLVLGSIVGLLLLVVLFTTAGRVVVSLGLPLLALSELAHRRQLRRVATERVGEDIGSFARAFDRRTEPFDPWVVRAVWDVLQPYVTFGGGRAPLRPSDRLGDDLRIDPDDIDMAIVQKVAARTGRSLERVEENPFHGRVTTVGDLVRLLSGQAPRGAE